MKCTLLKLLLGLSLISWTALADTLNVVFINPGHQSDNATGTFWSKVSLFMEAASEDLDINLTTFYADRNHIFMAQLTKEVKKQDPDFVILVNEKGKAVQMVKELAPLNVPIFMLLNTFDENEINAFSEAEKANIIGSLIPNNRAVGEKLADSLITTHLRKTAKPRLYMLAFKGDYATAASNERHQGLMDSLSKHKNIELVDVVVANWSEPQAYAKTSGLLKRVPIDIIWAANDPMAYGAKRATIEAKINYPITIGGINGDLHTSLFPLDVSYGGHMALGAYALVMLRDYQDKLLSDGQMHQNINVFSKLSKQEIIALNEAFSHGELSGYDFARFSLGHVNPVEFSFDKLPLVYSQPKLKVQVSPCP
ncbi:ABC transporter substrate-binding protein [Thalassotalea marina]|uniref:Sugar ABC transporter substrate-binding protein n=1 Tax=Thalassotalea marina TaxID=1673741 RepID=A0A919EMV9_9GAMM|nr:ABC transporter substrate-binding protein [Thalassotalea marina]GHG01543.1 sugar ABC transporter substrate-binding protein [Thalassotalea marina]